MRSIHKRSNGTSIIELCASLFVIVPLLILAIDCGFLFFGSAMATSACREAARWASNGQPADMSSVHSSAVAAASGPYVRAANALANYHTSGLARFNLDTLQVSENIAYPLPAAPFGGMANGTVTVSMEATIAPPIPLPMFPLYVNLPVRQSFPYTWVMPATPS